MSNSRSNSSSSSSSSSTNTLRRLSNSRAFADPKTGEFNRQSSTFREFISSSHPVYQPERNRYHLYVSLACPWAHRTLIARSLCGLEDIVSVSVVHWMMDEQSWRFLPLNESSFTKGENMIGSGDRNKRFSALSDLVKDSNDHDIISTIDCDSGKNREFIDCTIDHVNGFDRLKEVYYQKNADYSGRFTVPVLYDMKTKTIVNNESSEILRMFGTGVFKELVDTEKPYKTDLYPKKLRTEIDEIEDWIYNNINNGVYKTGFAESQQAYEKNVLEVFKYLDKVETHLKEKTEKLFNEDRSSSVVDSHPVYLVGEQITEADIRLYTTVVRFDPVYHQHFKCNFNTIRDGYPHIHKWLLNLYWNYLAFKDTTSFQHIKLHYTRSHPRINPLGITPLGPIPNIRSLQH